MGLLFWFITWCTHERERGLYRARDFFARYRGGGDCERVWECGGNRRICRIRRRRLVGFAGLLTANCADFSNYDGAGQTETCGQEKRGDFCVFLLLYFSARV